MTSLTAGYPFLKYNLVLINHIGMNKSLFGSLCIFYFMFLVTGVSFAQDSAMTIPLWKNGAPGFENKRDLREEAQDWWVRNIHNPSLVVYPAPASIATGVAI